MWTCVTQDGAILCCIDSIHPPLSHYIFLRVAASDNATQKKFQKITWFLLTQLRRHALHLESCTLLYTSRRHFGHAEAPTAFLLQKLFHQQLLKYGFKKYCESWKTAKKCLPAVASFAVSKINKVWSNGGTGYLSLLCCTWPVADKT